MATGRDGPGAGVSDGNAKATVADIGLTRKAIHDARRHRNAEALDPGVTSRTLDELPAGGKEPTKAAVNEAVSNVVSLKGRLPPLPTHRELEALSEADKAVLAAGNVKAGCMPWHSASRPIQSC